MTETEHMPSEERLRELLMWKKVVEARIDDVPPPDKYSAGPTGTLKLSDGTILKVWGNDGGCACDAGCYPLTELNTIDNAITNVEVEAQEGGEGDPCRTCGKGFCYEAGHDSGEEGHYRIFVFAEDQRFKLAEFDGSDGNGYYGTGWWLQVS
jgi:hypothetical protein